MKYGFRQAGRFKVGPQEAGEFLESLRISCGGILTPPAVVDAATPPDSPIHNAFTWEDSEAATEYRLHQARLLMNHLVRIREVGDEGPEEYRAFVHIRTDATEDVPQGRRFYTSLEAAMRDPDLRAEVLERARGELISWRSRYADLQELAKIHAKVDRLIDKWPSAVKA
jgi:hypothetical protein